MSLVEIDVEVNDDTAAGWASVLARVAAMETAIRHMADSMDSAAHSLGNINYLMANSGEQIQTTGDRAEMAGRRFYGFGGWVGYAARALFGGFKGVELWGGAFANYLPAWLGAAGAFGLIAHGVIEVAGVLVPAAIAFGAFAAAAVPTVTDIAHHLQNLQTVVEATGHSIYPLTGAFSKAADAAKPYVYQLFGDALVIAASKSSMFTQLVGQAGMVLADLGARFQLAITHGSTFGQIMQTAAHDLQGVGNVIGNIGGIIGALISDVPGYAQVFLNMAQGITHAAESIVIAANPVIKFGIAAHGAFLYAGLGATAFAKIMPNILMGVGNLAANIGRVEGPLARMGALGERAAGGLRAFGVQAAGASMLNWGWIAVAAGGFAALWLALASVKTETQQWTGSMQQALDTAPAVKGYSMLQADQTAIAVRLGEAQQTLAHTYHVSAESAGLAGRAAGAANLPYERQRAVVDQLRQAQTQFGQQMVSYSDKVHALAGQYGGLKIAEGLVTASGISLNDMTRKGADAMAKVRAEVAATSHAYAAMGQTGGRLGYDMSVLNKMSSDQFQQMQKLDQTWMQFVRLGTNAERNFVSLVGQMRQLDHESRSMHTSFTGVNNASLQLRSNMAQLLNTTQQETATMRDAHAPASALAAVLGTTYKEAVNAGALQNKIFYTTLTDQARQAGYTGNSIQQLKGFIDNNATSTQKLSDITDKYGGNLNKLPASKHTNVTNNASTAAGQAQNYINTLNSIPTSIFTYVTTVKSTIGKAAGGITSRAAGGGSGGLTLVGEQGPELIDIPSGSRVFPHATAQSMMMAGSSGVASPGKMTLGLEPGAGTIFEEMLLQVIRQFVRLRGGGDVQTAFGRP